MEYKTIIDDNGHIVDYCVMFIDKEPQHFIMKNYYKPVPLYKNNFIKPLWNGSKWVESATEEEIQAFKEENRVEVNNEENLIDKLILDNINMQIQIDSLIESQLDQLIIVK